MRLVDTNVLVHAVNADSPHHAPSVAWLDSALDGAERVGLAWLALVGFLRITTNPRVLRRPLSPDEAVDVVERWVEAPTATVLHPGPRHAFLLADVIRGVAIGGNIVNDAHLAALAIEHRAEIVTYDTDFARFPGVRWSPPPALAPGVNER